MKQNLRIKSERLLKKSPPDLWLLVMQIAALFFSSPVFSFAVKEDSFSKSLDFFREYSQKEEEKGISVVFFERQGEFLLPKCRIHPEKYPGILPDFVREAGSPGNYPPGRSSPLSTETLREEASAALSTAFRESSLLNDCGPDLSLDLSAKAEGFALYPQVAVVAPLVVGGSIVAFNVASCAVAGVVGLMGGWELAWERETDYRERRTEAFDKSGDGVLNYFPTRGEFVTGLAPVAGGSLSGLVTYGQVRRGNSGKPVAKAAARGAGGFGFMCGAAGGFVGYFYGKARIADDKTAVAVQRAKEANRRVVAFRRSLSEARENSLNLAAELEAAKKTLSGAQESNLNLAVELEAVKEALSASRESNVNLAAELEAVKEALSASRESNVNLAAELEAAEEALSASRMINLNLTKELEAAEEVLEIEMALEEKKLYANSLRADLAEMEQQIALAERALKSESGLVAAEISGYIEEAKVTAEKIRQTLEDVLQSVLDLESDLKASREAVLGKNQAPSL